MDLELLEHLNAAIMISDAHGKKIIFANQKAAELLGRPAADLAGLPLARLAPASQKKKHAALLKEATRKESASAEGLAVLHRDGREIPLRISASLASLPGQEALVLTLAGEGGAGHSQPGGRSEGDHFAALVAAAAELIFLIDRNGHIFYANPASEALLGYPAAELLAKPALLFIHPDDQKSVASDLARIFSGRKRKELQIRLRRKGGGVLSVEFKGVLVKPRQGEECVGVILHDVTKRKKTETLQQKQAAELASLNTALRLLIEQNSKALIEQERTIFNNLQHQVLPHLAQLSKQCRAKKAQQLLGLVRDNLKRITSQFPQAIATEIPGITPREFEVATLIRRGKSTKDISLLLSLSTRTVESYRDALRRKLGLKGRRVNLRSHLGSLG